MPRSFKDLFREAEEQDAYWVEAAIVAFTEGVCVLMEQQKVNRSELARRLGTSPSYVTKLLRGNVNFTLATMVKVVRALGGSLEPRVTPAPHPREDPETGGASHPRRRSRVALVGGLG